MALRKRLARVFLGRRKDIRDPGIFHRMALIPFLAWVGLGADGLSSSAYGPEEAFRALGTNVYLAIGLAVATAITVLVLSASYSAIIESFPSGGGGYLVATKLLGERTGVVSGAALIVDYILTITVSIASGVDAVFSFLPAHMLPHKFTVQALAMVLLTILNLRGVRESIVALMPFFIVFLITHAILIIGGLVLHAPDLPRMANDVSSGFSTGMKTLGLWGMALLFFRAYSLGAGTYTGIEAVANGLSLMREPRVETGKRTMVYMALSLSIVAAGVLVSYLVMNVGFVEGKTMNAVLAERLAGGWRVGPIPIGRSFVIAALVSEAVLLFVAAQAGFLGGPRVVSNMAVDSWLPHRFSALSDRLTTQNGVLFMGGSALLALFYTGGSVSTLLIMYSINVFVTFLLSEAGMLKMMWSNRRELDHWKKRATLFFVGLVMCALILAIVVYEKFLEGGWVTLVVTSALIALCFFIRRHYDRVNQALSHLDKLFADIPTDPKKEELGPCDSTRATAALFVGGYGGLGIHTMLTLLRMFPQQFTNMVFISVGVVDSGNFKGSREVEALKKSTREHLMKYVGLARRLGLSAEFKMAVGTDVVEEGTKLALEVAKEFPRTIFFSGKLIFEEQAWYQRILHNETAHAIQHRLQFAGHPMVVLPVRVRSRELKDSAHEKKAA